MTTTNPISENELEALANSLFPDLDAPHCAMGIENLAEHGDATVLSEAETKAESYGAGYPNYRAFANYGDFERLAQEYTENYSFEVPGQAAAHTGPQIGYSPKVMSEVQAAENEPQAAHKSVQGSNNARQKNNDKIIVGTKTLEQIRADFPILNEKINGYDLAWFDNGATTQRPQAVIDRLSYYYAHENSNVHRGAHELAARSTDAYENARQTVANFINANEAKEIVFVRGTTEGINLVANAYVKPTLQPDDEIILTLLEHHANIVPWQLVCEETGAVIKVAPVDDSGQIILSEYEKLFTKRTKFVSVTHVSNALGTVTPIGEMIATAHAHGVRIMIDGAQSIAHIPINVRALDADFFVFSGHKIYSPTGIGAVYGKYDLWEAARPYHGGGNMILSISLDTIQTNRLLYNLLSTTAIFLYPVNSQIAYKKF